MGRKDVKEDITLSQLRDKVKARKLERLQENKLAEHATGGTVAQFKTTKELIGHFGKIYACHWAEDSTHLASASQDGKLMIWDATTTNKRHMINLRSSWVMTCAYSSSGEYVACGGLDNLCSVYKVDFTHAETHDRPHAELSRHEGYLSCCRFVDDTCILTCSGDSKVIKWDLTQTSVADIFPGHSADVMSIALSPSQPNVFISGSCDHTVLLWDFRTKEYQKKFEGHTSDINCVQWFPEGPSFGSGSDDATIRLWDTRYYGQLVNYSEDNEFCGVTYIDFSKTGKYLFSGYDDHPYCRAWTVLEAEPIQHLAHKSRVSCLGVPQNGYCVVTGSWENTLRIWTAIKK